MTHGLKQQGTLKAAVLISGTGSNLKALIDAVKSGRLELDIVRVVSNRAEAGGIGYARAANIPISIISHKQYADRDAHDDAVARVLDDSQAELVVLAGYMRVLGAAFTARFNGRVINLHPSLLPLYKGLDTYNRALQAGEAEIGASIHVVTSALDSGPVIAQVRIPVNNNDDAASLKHRLGPLEHKLLVATVEQFCQGDLRFDCGQLVFRDQLLKQPLQMSHNGTIQ